MLEYLAFGLAGMSLLACFYLAQRVNVLQQRLDGVERNGLVSISRQPSGLELPEPAKALEGLRIAVEISQDHAHPVFADLLKEQLMKEEVAEVRLLMSGEGKSQLDRLKGGKPDFDILITGGLTCNGYAEVYYQAEFACYTANELICTLIERPPGGDRPSNLAIELITKLSSKLDDLERRSERRQALYELRGE